MELLSQWRQASWGAESQFRFRSAASRVGILGFSMGFWLGKKPYFHPISLDSMDFPWDFCWDLIHFHPILMYFNWACKSVNWSLAGRRRHGKHVALPWTSSNRRRWRAGLCWWLEPLAPAKRSAPLRHLGILGGVPGLVNCYIAIGNPPCWMGKSTISTGPFSIAMLNYQRVGWRSSYHVFEHWGTAKCRQCRPAKFRVWCLHGRGPSSGSGTRAGIEGKECSILHLDPIWAVTRFQVPFCPMVGSEVYSSEARICSVIFSWGCWVWEGIGL